MSITVKPAVTIYSLGRIARALGVPKEQAMAIDDALIDTIIHRISDLQSAVEAAKDDAAKAWTQVAVVKAECDEAQAEALP